jgi:hypothetical protein
MYRIVKIEKWEIVREWYCRTEEKAKEIVRTLIHKDYKLNFDVYDEIFEQENWSLEEFIEWVWEEKNFDDVLRVFEIEFEEDKEN